MSTLLRLSTPRLEKAIARAKVGNGTTFTARDLSAAPIGRKDPIARLRAKDREAEYRASARRCDERIAEWKAQLGITSTKGVKHG